VREAINLFFFSTVQCCFPFLFQVKKPFSLFSAGLERFGGGGGDFGVWFFVSEKVDVGFAPPLFFESVSVCFCVAGGTSPCFFPSLCEKVFLSPAAFSVIFYLNSTPFPPRHIFFISSPLPARHVSGGRCSQILVLIPGHRSAPFCGLFNRWGCPPFLLAPSPRDTTTKVCLFNLFLGRDYTCFFPPAEEGRAGLFGVQLVPPLFCVVILCRKVRRVSKTPSSFTTILFSVS